jgi:D-amino-acid dehydrogenase
MATHDVVVVGAGAIGLSTARRLARKGARVLVLDPRGPAGGASAGNAGLISPSHVVPMAAPGMVALGLKSLLDPAGPFRLTPRLDPHLWSWLWRFARHCTRAHVDHGVPILHGLLQRSRALMDQEARDLAPFHYATRGLLLIWNTPAFRDSLDHEAELCDRVGIPTRHLDEGALARLDPAFAGARGALFFPGDAHVDPQAYVAALAQDFEAHGGTLLRQQVSGLELRAGRCHAVHTEAGPVQAEQVLLAAGAWSAELVRPHGFALPLEAGRGFSLTFPTNAPGVQVPGILMEARVAVTPMGHRLRLGGTMELAGLDERRVPRRLQALAEAWSAFGLTTPLGDPATAEPWAGLRPCTPDALPYLGWLTPNLAVATGHGMLGISLAAVTGELMGDLLRGERPGLDLGPLDPRRFG